MTTAPESRTGPGPADEAVDTRSPVGPEGRVYTTPFARVWDEVLREIESRERWHLIHSDEDLGLVTVRCHGILPGRADDLAIWVSLDTNGLTRVDLRTEAHGRRSFRSGRKRVRKVLRALDSALGTGTRVRV
jgi:hypothetical protein